MKKIDKCRLICTKNYFFDRKFQELGLAQNCIGYYYLIDIMDVLINQEKTVRSFSREVYPEIALRYNKGECTIERDIRSCIDKCWNKDIKNKLTNFWTKPDKPTCREFIYLLKNYLMLSIA